MEQWRCDVAIVGAGVAGAALACQFRGSGLDVLVLEATPQILPINRGDHLAGASLELLDRTGILPFLERRGSSKVRGARVHGPEGGFLSSRDYTVWAPPYNYQFCLTHSQIQAGLLDCAGTDERLRLVRGFRVTGLRRDEQGAVVGVQGRQGGQDVEVEAQFVAACDGPQSRLRELAGISTTLEYYTDRMMMLTATRSPQQPPDQSREYWTPHGFMAMFPLPNDRVRCPVQASPGEVDEWRTLGLDALHEQLAKRLPVWAEMELIDEDVHAYPLSHHNAETYAADGLALVGDAAHTTPPFLGFGMGMALRDGYALAQLVQRALAEGQPLDRAALLPYEELCRPFNARVIELSDAYARLAMAKIPTEAELRAVLPESYTRPGANQGRNELMQWYREVWANEG